ncbi:MAG: hypothetical protein ACYCSO_07170 [Cuniculiplasma sp.]
MNINDNKEKEIELKHDSAFPILTERPARCELTRDERLRRITICWQEIIRASGIGNMLNQLWKFSQEIIAYMILDNIEMQWTSSGQAMECGNYAV